MYNTREWMTINNDDDRTKWMLNEWMNDCGW